MFCSQFDTNMDPIPCTTIFFFFFFFFLLFKEWFIITTETKYSFEAGMKEEGYLISKKYIR